MWKEEGTVYAQCNDEALHWAYTVPVSYTHLRAHETDSYLVCRLLLEKKKKTSKAKNGRRVQSEKERRKEKNAQRDERKDID